MDPSVAKTIAKVEREVSEGRHWRAKEVLQGAVRAQAYDQDLYERMGLLLLEMRDDLEAGRYLFASGRRRPEYEVAIALYLDKHGGHTADEVYRLLPTRAKLPTISDYPEPLAQELRDLGFDEDLPAPPTGPRQRDKTQPITPGTWACLVVVVVLLIGAVVSLYHVLRLIGQFIIWLLGRS